MKTREETVKELMDQMSPVIESESTKAMIRSALEVAYSSGRLEETERAINKLSHD